MAKTQKEKAPVTEPQKDKAPDPQPEPQKVAFVKMTEPNAYLSSVINQYLQAAIDSGAPYIFVSAFSDREPTQDEIDWLLSAIESDPKLGAFSLAIKGWHEFALPQHEKGFEVPFIHPCAVMYRTETLQKVGLLDTAYFELGWGADVDLGHRIRQGGYIVGCERNAFVTKSEKGLTYPPNYARDAQAQMQQGLVAKYGNGDAATANAALSVSFPNYNFAQFLPPIKGVPQKKSAPHAN